MTGLKVGRLTVMQFGEHRRTKSGASKRYWKCVCDCGNITYVTTDCLRKGNIKSCGCLKREVDKTKKTNLRHGKSKTRLYKIWVDMKRRCNSESRAAYKYYGGKGISYDDKWNKFEEFFAWAMANGYTDTLTLDRIDGNKDYEPSNCRWVGFDVQANNTSRNHFITFNGKTLTIAQWAKELNISRCVINDRINKLGWSVEDALSIKPNTKTASEKLLTLNGETHNIGEWAERLNVNRRTITERIKKGLPIEQVLSPLKQSHKNKKED